VSEERSSVSAALTHARSRGIARLDAQLMLARLMGATRTWLIAHDDALLSAGVALRWADWLERRSSGEPLAYLLGEKEFRGLVLEVTPAVLVPRPETELLVDWADTLLRRGTGRETVVDLGTGSGAIALAVKHEHPRSRVVATDASREALAVARGNARRLSLAVELVEATWWRGLEGRRFHLVLANPPYVREDDPALEFLRHEPHSALTPGGDGLGAFRAIVADAADHLRADAWLLFEHGFDQAAPVRRLLDAAGFVDAETRHDLAGQPRATGARWPAAPP
jgi:release factor glutamine methyltransferase